MAISYSSLAASVTNWQPVTSSTPTGVSTVTFSGLSGYSKYRIKAPNLTCNTGTPSIQLRINGDSGANYSTSGVTYSSGNPTSWVLVGYNNFYIGYTTTTATGLITVDIENALLSNPKQITFIGGSGSGFLEIATGMYYGAAAPITSITVLLSANNFFTGTIYLEGAN